MSIGNSFEQSSQEGSEREGVDGSKEGVGEKAGERWARKEKEMEAMVEWFEEQIEEHGEYSETLVVEEGGGFDRKRRLDDEHPPIILSLVDLKGPEDLYKFMRRVLEGHPEFAVSFDVDPSGNWIKYRVSTTESRE